MSTNVVNSLVKKLEARQIKEGMSARRFAKSLGISPELWRLILSGQRAISIKTIRGILAIYPELKEDIFSFLIEPDGRED